MQRYSFFDLARKALRGNAGWRAAWREPRLKAGYDVVVIGGGGYWGNGAWHVVKGITL